MKHTPGPWTTRKEKRALLVCDEYGNQVALVRPVSRYGVDGDTEANARLIKEAPMYHSILKDFIESVQDSEDDAVLIEAAQKLLIIATARLYCVEGL